MARGIQWISGACIGWRGHTVDGWRRTVDGETGGIQSVVGGIQWIDGGIPWMVGGQTADGWRAYSE